MNAVNDIILLGEKLRETRDLILRSDSLENACRETEARLESLRAAEKVVKAETRAAHELAERILQGAKDSAADVARIAEAQGNAIRREAQVQGARVFADAEEKAAQALGTFEVHAEAVVELEAEEATLGQNVAALRAEINSLKEKARTLLA